MNRLVCKVNRPTKLNFKQEVAVKFIRRVLLAVSVASAVAGVIRFKGKGVGAIKQGGWRKVTDPKQN